MSRFKIVKKHGHLEKRPLRRSAKWTDWKEKLIRGVVNRSLSWMSVREEAVAEKFPDAEYVVWCLLVLTSDMGRRYMAIEFYALMHEGRGIRITLAASSKYGAQMRTSVIASVHERLMKWMPYGIDKLVGWHWEITTQVSPEVSAQPHIKITLYPPKDSNFYAVCRELYEKHGDMYTWSVMHLQEAIYAKLCV